MSEAHEYAKQMTDAENRYAEFDGKDLISAGNQKVLDGELHDLVEYVKWITGETTTLRERLRIAEGIMNSLRKSGEMSVEKMIKALLKLKHRQDALDA